MSDGSEETGPHRRSSAEIYALELEEGVHILERPWQRTLVSAVAAGLELGFSVLLIAIMYEDAQNVLSPPVFRFVIAAMYSVGFILVVLGRSELFTEHTTLAVLPVLGGRANVGELLKHWGVVLAGNIAGATAFAWLVTMLGPSLGVTTATFDHIATEVVDHPAIAMVASAMLAGWLMGLLSWLVAASRDTISQIAVVSIITGAIGIAGLHHSVAGSLEVIAGVFVHGHTTVLDFLRFLVLAVLGNAIGGVVFVAVLKWAHAKPAPDEV